MRSPETHTFVWLISVNGVSYSELLLVIFISGLWNIIFCFLSCNTKCFCAYGFIFYNHFLWAFSIFLKWITPVIILINILSLDDMCCIVAGFYVIFYWYWCLILYTDPDIFVTFAHLIPAYCTELYLWIICHADPK